MLEYLNKLNLEAIKNSGVFSTFIVLSDFKYPNPDGKVVYYKAIAIPQKFLDVLCDPQLTECIDEHGGDNLITSRLSLLGFKKLYVIYVINDLSNYMGERFFSFESRDKAYYVSVNLVHYTEFFCVEGLKSISEGFVDKKNTSVVFIFSNISFATIKMGLELFGVKISAGNTTSRGFLSTLEFLLAKIIALFYGFETPVVKESFVKLSKVAATRSRTQRSVMDYSNKVERGYIKVIKEKLEESLLRTGNLDIAVKNIEAAVDEDIDKDKANKEIETVSGYMKQVATVLTDKKKKSIKKIKNKKEYHTWSIKNTPHPLIYPTQVRDGGLLHATLCPG